jgi:hypothetical protein
MLSAIVVYHMLSMGLPPWVIDYINKICRAFLWHGSKDANGGHCLVAWWQVGKPLSMGGLSIHNLKIFFNLHCGWDGDCLRENAPTWAWHGRSFSLPSEAESFSQNIREAESLLQAACKCVVGKGNRMNFCNGRWIEGRGHSQITANMVRQDI